jgi:hypothetical protein
LSPGRDNVYDGAIDEHKNTVEYRGTEDEGICMTYGVQNKSFELSSELL